MMKLDYPVKYVPVAVFENEQIAAYVAVKCYLLESFRMNHMNYYKVLPFYTVNKKDVVPQYFNGEIINYNYSDVIFDDLNSARNYTEKRTYIIASGKVASKKRINKYINNYLNKYYYLEEYLCENELDDEVLSRSLKKGE